MRPTIVQHLATECSTGALIKHTPLGCELHGDVAVVRDPSLFLGWLKSNTTGPYGLDCETIGVDPTKESPVGKGSIVCWSLAWVDQSLGVHRERGTSICRSAFLWADSLATFDDWLAVAPVVGHNIFSFDRHIFANHGIKLGGVVADTLRCAKLLDANSVDNSLKSWMARAFGYGVGEYKELFSRAKPGALEENPECRTTWRKVDGQRVPTIVGTAAQRVNAQRELIPLDTLEQDYGYLLPTLYQYAALDAKGTLELYFLLRKRLEQTPWRGLGCSVPWGNLWQLYEQFWNESLFVLNNIERNGIQYDARVAAEGKYRAFNAADTAAQKAYEWIGREINLDSPAQLAEVLYREKFFDIPPVTGTLKAIKANHENKETTSEAALVHLANEANPSDAAGIGYILEQRKLTDLIQFLDKLPTFQDAVGRIHTILKPDTRTGRLSSSKPNLQNIPKEDTYGLRSAFVAATGHKLIVADYAALEPRIQAHFLVALFGDRSLLEAINFGDVYSGVARDCWPEVFHGWSAEAVKAHPLRSEAKVVLLAKAYGKGLRGMALQLKKPLWETKAIVERIEAAYPGMVRFQKYMAEYAREHGGVHTLLGRFRPLPDIRSQDRGKRSAAERQAMNSPIQGSASDIVTAAMLKLYKHVKIVLQVHDELIVECASDKADSTLLTVKDIMQNPLKPGLFRVPLVVEAKIGNNWKEAK